MDAAPVIGIAAVVIYCLWERNREAQRPADADFDARQGEYGLRLVVVIAGALVVVVLALILDALGVSAAGWIALVGLLVLLAVVAVGGWLGPKRGRN